MKAIRLKNRESLEPVSQAEPLPALHPRLLQLRDMLSNPGPAPDPAEVQREINALKARIKELKQTYEEDMKNEQERRLKMQRFGHERNKLEFQALRKEEKELLKMLGAQDQSAKLAALREEARQKAESLSCIFKNYESERAKVLLLEQENAQLQGRSKRQDRASDLYEFQRGRPKDPENGRKSMIDIMNYF
jgi:hypothetical protein